jgi:hypothetical protein
MWNVSDKYLPVRTLLCKPPDQLKIYYTETSIDDSQYFCLRMDLNCEDIG